MILAVGFFVVSSKAELLDHETALPEEAGPYYRKTSEDDREYFGPEIRSFHLCNMYKGFNIESTTEAANIRRIRAANGNLGIRWTRNQDWRFGENAPWGGTLPT